jgi:choloylglycine hydrolase
MKLRASSTILLLSTLLALTGWCAPGQLQPNAVEGTCTSFCLNNGGYSLFGTNYDNEIWEGLLFVNKRGVTKTGWEAGTTGRYARWTAQYGSVTFNLAGVQMPWAGMNEAGLTISTMWLREARSPAPDERPPLISPLWIQYQLDTCATIEEVMANNARVRIADTVDHFLVCDRSAHCAAVEFLEGRTVYHTGDALPVMALTNHPYDRAVGAWERADLRSNSLERFGIAADGQLGFQPGETAPAVAYAFDILDRASGQKTGGTPTQWSIVFDTENLRVHWRTNRSSQARGIDFTRLDFVCGTPIEMLDVHAALAGDVSNELGKYTFEANLQHTLHFLEEWDGIELSALEVEVLERGLNSFACQRQVSPYQEEVERLLSPLVGWAALVLLHRFWVAGPILAFCCVVLVVWRTQSQRRRR